MDTIILRLTTGEALELKELLDKWLVENSDSQFAEAHSGFTEANKKASDKWHRLRVISDLLAKGLEQ